MQRKRTLQRCWAGQQEGWPRAGRSLRRSLPVWQTLVRGFAPVRILIRKDSPATRTWLADCALLTGAMLIIRGDNLCAVCPSVHELPACDRTGRAGPPGPTWVCWSPRRARPFPPSDECAGHRRADPIFAREFTRYRLRRRRPLTAAQSIVSSLRLGISRRPRRSACGRLKADPKVSTLVPHNVLGYYAGAAGKARRGARTTGTAAARRGSSKVTVFRMLGHDVHYAHARRHRYAIAWYRRHLGMG